MVIFVTNIHLSIITVEFSLEDGLKDDLKNISLFCRANAPNIRPDDESLLWKLSNRWGVKGYGQILNDDDIDDLSDWKYWFTALSIICGTKITENNCGI